MRRIQSPHGLLSSRGLQTAEGKGGAGIKLAPATDPFGMRTGGPYRMEKTLPEPATKTSLIELGVCHGVLKGPAFHPLHLPTAHTTPIPTATISATHIATRRVVR